MKIWEIYEITNKSFVSFIKKLAKIILFFMMLISFEIFHNIIMWYWLFLMFKSQAFFPHSLKVIIFPTFIMIFIINNLFKNQSIIWNLSRVIFSFICHKFLVNFVRHDFFFMTNDFWAFTFLNNLRIVHLLIKRADSQVWMRKSLWCLEGRTKILQSSFHCLISCLCDIKDNKSIDF